jgi:peptidoglycan/xylan/chitin deacetylase (PgdA/CDA1 family)
MIRRLIKAGTAQVLYRTGLDKLAGSFFGGRKAPLIIGYHRVVEDFASSTETAIPSLLVSRKMLERHLDWIGRTHRFLDLNELCEFLEGDRPIDRPVAAITFDDGYQDFYYEALPLLQRKGIPAALFVATGLVGTSQAQLHDKLYLLLSKRPQWTSLKVDSPLPDIAGMTPYRALRVLLESVPSAVLQQVIKTLESRVAIPEQAFAPSVTWEMLDRIRRAGIVIGSHTKNHIVMTNETFECVLSEAVESRRELECRLGMTVRHFAYPSGIYDSECLRAVEAAGYRFAYTTCSHRSLKYPRLTAPRTFLWENACVDSTGAFSESVMSCQVHRAFTLAAGCRQRHATAEGAS